MDIGWHECEGWFDRLTASRPERADLRNLTPVMVSDPLMRAITGWRELARVHPGAAPSRCRVRSLCERVRIVERHFESVGYR